MKKYRDRSVYNECITSSNSLCTAASLQCNTYTQAHSNVLTTMPTVTLTKATASDNYCKWLVSIQELILLFWLPCLF